MNEALRGNLCGILALLLWSTLVGLMRSVTEAFGVEAGTALIFSVGAVAMLLKDGVPKVGRMPRAYLFGAGALFVAYDIAFALAIGLSRSAGQALEAGMLNYLWPCLVVVFSIWINKTRMRWWVWPGTALSVVGLYWCVAANSGVDLGGFIGNLLETPAPYVCGLTAAVSWALYCNISVRYSKGANAVPLFLAVVAVILWAGFFMRGGRLYFPGYLPVCQLLFIGVASGLSFSLWEHGIHHGSFILLAVCSYFTPALSMLFAAVWLNAMPPSGYWAGVGLVVLGSLICWLASIRRERAVSSRAG